MPRCQILSLDSSFGSPAARRRRPGLRSVGAPGRAEKRFSWWTYTWPPQPHQSRRQDLRAAAARIVPRRCRQRRRLDGGERLLRKWKTEGYNHTGAPTKRDPGGLNARLFLEFSTENTEKSGLTWLARPAPSTNWGQVDGLLLSRAK